MAYKSASLEKYLSDLAARSPAPGGGSAAAVNAAMGAALISMVVNFTIGKPKYKPFEKDLKDILVKSEKLRQEFLNLVDLDVAAYKSKNVRDAIDVPFMLARLCFEGAKLAPPLIRQGNSNLISDVAVAIIFLEAAFASACFNVEINLKCLGDKKFSAQVRKELSLKGKTIKKIRLKTEERVGQIIRG